MADELDDADEAEFEDELKDDNDEASHDNRWFRAYNQGFDAGRVAESKEAARRRQDRLLNWFRASAVTFLVVNLYVYGPKPSGATEVTAIGVVGFVTWMLLAFLTVAWVATEGGRLWRWWKQGGRLVQQREVGGLGCPSPSAAWRPASGGHGRPPAALA